jgi:hypothetical protein
MAIGPSPAVQFAPESVPLSVYLCSTPLDLSTEREQLLREIDRLNGGFPRVELHDANKVLTESNWRSDVRRSDLLLLPVGSSYSDRLPGHAISLAEEQYREGIRLGKPCLIYFRKLDSLSLRRYSYGHSTKRSLLDEWRSTLVEEHQVRFFDSVDHLGRLVGFDLKFILRAIQDRPRRNRDFSIAEAVQTLDRLLRLSRSESDKSGPDSDALDRNRLTSVETLGLAVGWGLGQPRGQRRRVAAFTIAICRVMKLPRPRVESIACCAFLCDIGKIAIPGELWSKVELTEQDRAAMQQHPRRGHEMLSKVEVLREAAEVVYAIEERYDGKGYPRGLVGELIPFGARVVSVARSFETSITEQQGTPGERISEAKRRVERDSGCCFDPRVVRAFMRVHERVWLELIEEIGKLS